MSSRSLEQRLRNSEADEQRQNDRAEREPEISQRRSFRQPVAVQQRREHLRLDFRPGHFAERRGVNVVENFRHRADDDDFVAETASRR